jgi:hypothetical protein
VAVALLTIMGMVVAPICAPLCAASSCNSGGHVGASGSRCAHMKMHQNGFGVESRAAARCGNGELAATLNGVSDKVLQRRAGQVRTAAGNLASSREIPYPSENWRLTRCNVANTGPMRGSSASVVLKI